MTTRRKNISDGPAVGGGTVTVEVGEAENVKKFTIHTDLLVHHSDFCAAALKNGWKEASGQVIRLPKEKPELLEIFLRFRYRGNIYSIKHDDQVDRKNDDYFDHCRLLATG